MGTALRIEDSLTLLHGRRLAGRVLLLALLPCIPPFQLQPFCLEGSCIVLVRM